jgi:hypothetical protein
MMGSQSNASPGAIWYTVIPLMFFFSKLMLVS